MGAVLVILVFNSITSIDQTSDLKKKKNGPYLAPHLSPLTPTVRYVAGRGGSKVLTVHTTASEIRAQIVGLAIQQCGSHSSLMIITLWMIIFQR